MFGYDVVVMVRMYAGYPTHLAEQANQNFQCDGILDATSCLRGKVYSMEIQNASLKLQGRP